MNPIKVRLQNINNRIREYEAIKEEKKLLHDQYPDDFSLELSLHSLNAQINALMTEKQKLLQEIGVEELDFRLHGLAVEEGTASIKTVGFILVGLQEIITMLSHGASLAFRGPVKRTLAKMTQLQMAEVYPGSFGFKIISSDKQSDLLPEGDVMHKTIERLFDIFGTAKSAGDIAELTERISIRTINQFKRLIEYIAQNNLSFDIKWIGQYNERREWNGTPDQIQLLINSLRVVEQYETSIEEKIGYIVTAAGKEYKFKFEEEGTREEFVGVFKEELRDDIIDAFFRSKVKCRFEKTTIRNVVPEKTTWVLIDIQNER